MLNTSIYSSVPHPFAFKTPDREECFFDNPLQSSSPLPPPLPKPCFDLPPVGAVAKTPWTPPVPVRIDEFIGNNPGCIPVTSPKSALPPSSSPVENIREHVPKSVLEVERIGSKAKITVPEAWKNIGPCIYIFWTMEGGKPGKVYVGESIDLEGRMSSHQSAFNEAPSSPSDLPMYASFRDGNSVYWGVLHVCSSRASMDQNETCFIRDKKPLLNKTRGNGSVSDPFGSPLKDGTGGFIPAKVRARYLSGTNHRDLPVTDPSKDSDLSKIPLKYDHQKKEHYIEVPFKWVKLTDEYDELIYIFKDHTGKSYTGHTKNLRQRLSRYMSDVNTGKDTDLANAIRKGIPFTFSLLAIVSGNNAVNHERQYIESVEEDKRYNVRIKEGGDPTSPARAIVLEPSKALPGRFVRIPSRRGLKKALFEEDCPSPFLASEDKKRKVMSLANKENNMLSPKKRKINLGNSDRLGLLPLPASMQKV